MNTLNEEIARVRFPAVERRFFCFCLTPTAKSKCRRHGKKAMPKRHMVSFVGIRARVKRLEGAYANHCTCSTRRGGRNTRKLSKCNRDIVVALHYSPRTTEA